jgi:dihydroflavonol-4-reductase
VLPLGKESRILFIGEQAELIDCLKLRLNTLGFFKISMVQDLIHSLGVVNLNDFLSDNYLIESALVNFDIVIYTHAYVNYQKTANKRLYTDNVLQPRNLVNAMLHVGDKYLVYLSTTEALDRKFGEHRINETDTWEKNKFRTSYSKSRFLGEMEVWRGIAEGLNALIISPSNIVSPNTTNSLVALLRELLQSDYGFRPKGSNGFTDLRDLCSFIALALNQEEVWNEKYILNSANIAYADFFEIAFRIQERTPSKFLRIQTVSQPILRWYHNLQELKYPSKAVQDLFDLHLAFDSAKAQESGMFTLRSPEELVAYLLGAK